MEISIKTKISKIIKKSILAVCLVAIGFVFTEYNDHLYNGVLNNIFEGLSTETFANTAGTTDFEEVRNKLVSVLKLISEWAFLIIYPILTIIGKLLSNEWVFGEQNLNEVIQVLWVLIRNFVNIIFALILIFIAFVNITGATAGNSAQEYAISTSVPRIIVGIILINFSLFFTRFVVDIAAITTNAVASIPMNIIDPEKIMMENLKFIDRNRENDVNLWRTEFILDETEARILGITGNREEAIKQYNAGEIDNNPFVRYKCKIPKNMIFHLNKKSIVARVQNTDENAQNLYGILDPKTGQIVGPRELYGMDDASIPGITKSGKGGQFDHVCINSVTDLALSPKNIAFLIANNVINIPGLLAGTQTENWDTLIVNSIFNFVFLFISLIAFTAIAIALAVRAIMLWIMMILSPLWIAMMVLPGSLKNELEGKMNSFGAMSFVSLAFMPTLIVAPMIISFILATLTLLYESSNSDIEGIQLGGITVFFSNLNVAGYPTLYHMFMGILAIVALFYGVRLALDRNEYIKSATQPVLNLGDQTLKYIAQSPLYYSIPFSSSHGTGSISAAGLQEASKNLFGNIERERREESVEELARALPGLITTPFSKLSKEIKDLNGSVEGLNSVLGKADQSVSGNPAKRQQYISLLKESLDKFTDQNIKNLKEKLDENMTEGDFINTMKDLRKTVSEKLPKAKTEKTSASSETPK